MSEVEPIPDVLRLKNPVVTHIFWQQSPGQPGLTEWELSRTEGLTATIHLAPGASRAELAHELAHVWQRYEAGADDEVHSPLHAELTAALLRGMYS